MIICIDSHVFIWGIKKEASVGQEEMIDRATLFFDWADSNKHQILIPSVVVAEVLAIEPLEKYQHYIDIINKEFIVADFDLRASTRYAQLFNNRFDVLKDLYKNVVHIPRDLMKIDHLIISCALVNGASCIYTIDKGLISFAKGFIDTRELPHLPPRQSNLFTGTGVDLYE